MLYLITIIVWFIIGSMPFPDEKILPGQIIITSLFFFISILSQCVRYWSQVDNIETVKEHRNDILILEEQCNELVEEIKIYCFQKFPEQELAIFDKITKDTSNVLATMYPEIKSDKIFIDGLDQILQYKNAIYKTKRSINGIIQMINTRSRTIWLTGLPILPKLKN